MYSLVIDGKYARACHTSEDIGSSTSYSTKLATSSTELFESRLTEQCFRSFFRGNLPPCIKPRLIFDLFAGGHHHSATDRVEGVSSQRGALYHNIQRPSSRIEVIAYSGAAPADGKGCQEVAFQRTDEECVADAVVASEASGARR